jgi:replicative superfamily II helicase
LTQEGREQPVLELWWSQREALAQNLLDPYKRAISIQMPTSAGKTLLAEFAIVQSLALNPASSIAYVVPTRALVAQITRRLRADLEGVRLGERAPRVETAVPVFELDPTEDMLLRERPEILVTTLRSSTF